jgi:hypothetical protein
VQLISPFVGRIYDWFKATNKRDYSGAELSRRNSFNHPFDDDARNLLCQALERNVVPVDASALATLGGALNCISLGF